MTEPRKERPPRTVAVIAIVLSLLTSACTIAQHKKPPAAAIDFSAIPSPIIFKGDAATAYRDPTAVYHNGTFYLYYTYIIHENQKIYWCTALSKSTDLVHWTKPKRLTPKDRTLNFCAPGNVIRRQGKWLMCFQTYPTPQGRKYGNENARVWTTTSSDLENWTEPKILRVKGPDVPTEKMGRLIDPYLIQDKDDPKKWWCFFDDNAANLSYSYDLENWTYFNRIPAGENVCVLPHGGEYLMFHSPSNGIAIKRSTDMKNWYDVGPKTAKHDTGPITLGQKNWPWAKGRLSAAFVLDLKDDPRVGKYLMFFHASGPHPEPVNFDTFSSLALAFSDDLQHWTWPRKNSHSPEPIIVDAPFDMPAIIPPAFPDKTFDIRNYGAVADTAVKNTDAFAKAIDACAKAGGGRVLVPKGTWLTGPIHLKSNVNLHLQKDAVIRFSTDFDDYLPPVLTRYEGIECYNYSPLIYANGCTNIALTGRGKLDGQGKAWWKLTKKQDRSARRLYDMTKGVPVKDRIFATEDSPLRPSFVQMLNCNNVLIEGITVNSGPMWTIHPVYCQNLIVRGITLHTKGPNNDGVNPDSCKNVLIENCNFDTADDAIAIKSGKNEDGWRVNRPSENIVIRNCRFGLGKPCDGVVSIGSEMSGAVRNVYFHDCYFDKTNRAFRIKSKRGRGGIVENIYLKNITTTNIRGQAILLNTFYGSDSLQPFSEKPPLFRNIHIENISCQHTKEAVKIIGLPEQPIENVTLENLTIAADEGLTCENAKNIKLVNINIKPHTDPVVTIKDSQNVTIENPACPNNTNVFLRLEGKATQNIRLIDADLTNARTDVQFRSGAEPNALTALDFSAIPSPIILKGDENQAFRDPAVIYHDGLFRIFYTYWLKAPDQKRYSYVATSRSRDLIHFTKPRILTPQDLNLNFSSPGNIIRYKDQWLMCYQTYPTPQGQKYGNDDCRVWTTKSRDLENWGPPEMLKVKGPNVPVEDMGRLIDPYLVQDKDVPGKWWCFFDDNAANLSYSYDLETWTYFSRIPAGENPCVIIKDDHYLLFHSPGNGIGIKRSADLKNWQDVGGPTTKQSTGPITLGQKNWPWAAQRLTAAFVLDLKDDPNVARYVMFFHAEPPGGFKKHASIAIAFSHDLENWTWPAKKTDK